MSFQIENSIRSIDWHFIFMLKTIRQSLPSIQGNLSSGRFIIITILAKIITTPKTGEYDYQF